MSQAVDPGRLIAWARTPSYSINLINNLHLIPRERASRVLSSAAGLSAARKEQRTNDLADLTVALFLDGGDLAKRARHQRSLVNRIKKLVDEFEIAVRELDHGAAYDREHALAEIRKNQPWFDQLDEMLEYDQADESEDEDEQASIYSSQGDAASVLAIEESDEDGNDDPMQGIEHHPHQPDCPLPQQHASPARRQRAPAFHQSPPPPRPQANPVALAQPVYNPADFRQDNDGLCPNCQLELPADQAAAEAHMGECFGDDGVEDLLCPVCGADLREVGQRQREAHVEACCKQGTGGAAGGVAVEDYVVFTADIKSVPKDPATTETAECGVCFENYEVGESLVRLSCYCVYHEDCMNEWWKVPTNFCPLHRRVVEPDTMAVG